MHYPSSNPDLKHDLFDSTGVFSALLQSQSTNLPPSFTAEPLSAAALSALSNSSSLSSSSVSPVAPVYSYKDCPGDPPLSRKITIVAFFKVPEGPTKPFKHCQAGSSSGSASAVKVR